jgi:autotransporter-associated beta strand protein
VVLTEAVDRTGALTLSGAVNLGNAARTLTINTAATLSGVVGGTGGGFTKAGNGTLTLSGANTYTGGTTLGAGVLRLEHASAAGTGTITQSNASSTLQINTTGTVANAMNFYNIQTLQTVTLSGNKTLNNNASYNVAADSTTTESGVLTGSGGITKQGTGTLTVTGSNSFAGAVDVQAGLLNLNSATGGAAASTISVAVATNATLLVSVSGQVSDTAAVTLSGGTIQRGAGVSEVFGNLNITTGSFLDFGTGATGNLTFGTYQNNTTPSALLTLSNFLPGNSFTFSSTSFTTNNVASYFTFGTGYAGSSISNTGSTFTITAIPEPSTYVAAIGLALLLLGSSRRLAAGRGQRGGCEVSCGNSSSEHLLTKP